MQTLPRPYATIDRVRIASSISKRSLVQRPAIRALRAQFPSVNVTTIELGPKRSAVEFTYVPGKRFRHCLAAAEPDFGSYSVTRLELALDFPARSEHHARELVEYLVKHVRKRWHRRKRVLPLQKMGHSPPIGIIEGPTWYWEDRSGSTAMKLYARYPKFPIRRRGTKPLARLEWTLTRAQNVSKKTGIRTVRDILHYSGGQRFIDAHLRLESLNWHKFGKWLDPGSKVSISRNGFIYDGPRRTAAMWIRSMAANDVPLYRGDSQEYDRAILLWSSASQIRGYLRTPNSKPGRPTVWAAKVRKLSPGKIDRFFEKISAPKLRRQMR